MKKILLSLSLVTLVSGVAVAQSGHEGHNHTTISATPPGNTVQDSEASNLKTTDMAFVKETHDFGTIPEGPKAEYEFKFTNKGSEPINIQKVQASCGCTTPSYSKEPVKPGEVGTIKAVYNTQGRPAPFNKTITVISNAGTKVLYIKGTVEKSPDGSVPKSNSMMKTL